MADFKEALGRTLLVEGGYVVDPKDPGGETIKGIARKKHPNWNGWELVDAQKSKPCFPQCALANNDINSLIAKFYKEMFWDKMKLDHLVNQAVAEELFDTYVNTGRGAKYFQETLNLYNRGQKDYADLVVDGAIGNKSLEAFKSFMNTQRFSSRNKQKNEKVFLKVLNYFQVNRYVSIAKANENLENFFYGWIDNRVD